MFVFVCVCNKYMPRVPEGFQGCPDKLENFKDYTCRMQPWG